VRDGLGGVAVTRQGGVDILHGDKQSSLRVLWFRPVDVVHHRQLALLPHVCEGEVLVDVVPDAALHEPRPLLRPHEAVADDAQRFGELCGQRVSGAAAAHKSVTGDGEDEHVVGHDALGVEGAAQLIEDVPRRAVRTHEDVAAWHLEPTELEFGLHP
jgi:hypothetical protein